MAPRRRRITGKVERALIAPRSKSQHVGVVLRTAAGDEYVLRRRGGNAFHDAVLELGSVPLPVLEARIDAFIAEGGRGPYPDLE